MSAQQSNRGKGYIYVEMAIKDPARFKEYTQLSAPAVRAAGGRYIVGGARPELLEGRDEAERVVIVEFETVAQARDFYWSSAYQTAREKRTGGVADFRMVLVEGAG